MQFGTSDRCELRVDTREIGEGSSCDLDCVRLKEEMSVTKLEMSSSNLTSNREERSQASVMWVLLFLNKKLIS